MRYYFKPNECVYIKQISETKCEYVKLEFEDNVIVPKLGQKESEPYNVVLFLSSAIRITEEHYLAIYNRLTA